MQSCVKLRRTAMNNRPRWETDSVSKTESVWMPRISILSLLLSLTNNNGFPAHLFLPAPCGVVNANAAQRKGVSVLIILSPLTRRLRPLGDVVPTFSAPVHSRA